GDELILLRAMVQTFVAKSLCLQEETPQGTLLVFPAYFRLDRPPITDYPGVFVTYRFAGPLDEIYTTLIVRLHYTDNFEMAQLWQYAADFTTFEGRRVGLIMHKRADDRAEIEVYFEPEIPDDTRVSFIKYIHEHLRKRAQEVERIRTYRCHTCNTIIPHERVRQRLERGRTTVICDLCDETLPLNDLIEEKFASDEFARTVRVMDEQAQIQIDRESLELILAGHAMATATEAGQRFVLEHDDELETDGYILLRDEAGEWSEQRIYLKFLIQQSLAEKQLTNARTIRLQSTDALQQRWRASGQHVSYLVRTADGVIRWFYQTVDAQHATDPDFDTDRADPFTALNLERVRRIIFVGV
ncbi:MAG: hypothetical protein KDE53_25065, partial [Caldilineaceae bacterium]|nr:hypothetical protein [Caldilineaceae bacterium]